jgi:AcrR family transcriptional regulator
MDDRSSTARGRPARFTADELLDLVVGEFNARGYDATSMEDVARATGLTKSAVYHHVSGKEELLRLAVARAVDALFDVLDEPPATSGPPLSGSSTCCGAAPRCWSRCCRTSRCCCGCAATPQPSGGRWTATGARPQAGALVQDAVDAGDVRRDLDPRLVTRLLFGMVNSISEWYRADGARGAEEIAGAVVALAVDGLRRR